MNTDYLVRPFEEADRASVKGLGIPVVDWWHNQVLGASLHLVVVHKPTSEVVADLQIRDRGVPEPSRCEGQCHLILHVAPAHRRQGVGGQLFDLAHSFAQTRNATTLYAAYRETPDAPAASFLSKRGFQVLERFYPSYLDLEAFNPSRFEECIRRVEAQEVRLTTYEAFGDTPLHRCNLYELEQISRKFQPFRDVQGYIPKPYEEWEEEFLKRDRSTIFIALPPSEKYIVGVVTELEWYFTGTHPNWCGKGIATALKVLCIQEAKRRGYKRMDTENHEDNAAMLAVNRKLGFVFTAPEVACTLKMK